MSLFNKKQNFNDTADTINETKKNKRKKITRVDEIRQRLENGELDDYDPEEIISAYMPHRRISALGRAILRLDRTRLALLLLLLVVMALFILAFMQEKMGNFTINLNRLELFRKGISISENGDFTNATSRLTAGAIQDATNISIHDLPKNLNELDGDNSGLNYMAYTYYVRNAGKEDLGYVARVNLDSCAKGAEKAVRVVLWQNDERTVYAAPSANGEPEEGCVNFESDDVVCTIHEDEFRVGDVNRYTIVIFMEGDDPDCVDSIVGGSTEFSMKIDAEGLDDRSLLMKFIQDIQEFVTGDKAINAAGTNAPNYYASDITWANRRNQ